MPHTIKILLISVISLFVITVIVFTTTMVTRLGSRLNSYFNNNYSKSLLAQKEVQILPTINIDANASKIVIESSEDEQIQIDIYSENPDEYYIKHDENKLDIYLQDEEKLLKSDKYLKSMIVVNIPSNYNGNININDDIGDVEISNIPSLKAKIKLNIGDLKIDEVSELEVKMNIGDIEVNKVNEYLDISLDTGDVQLNSINLIKDSSINVKIGEVEIEKTNDIYINAHSKVGEVKIENNNRKADITLNIEVDAGEIDVVGNNVTTPKKIKDLDVYDNIQIDKVESVDVTKYTEGGDNRETYTEKEDIVSFYNMIGNTKIGEETTMSCEDNTTVYTFNMDKAKISFEFECEWLVLNGKRYTIVK